MSFLRHYAVKSSMIFVYSLFGLNFNLGRASAEENILVIHSYDSQLPSAKKNQLAIEQGFEEIGSQNNIYHEFLDCEYNTKTQQGQEFAKHIDRKYRQADIDLLMVIEEPGLDFVWQKHNELFPNLPVVFMGIETVSQELLDTPWLTGVVEERSIVETALEATKQTWSNTVVVINDSSEGGRADIEQIKAIEQSPEQLRVDTINDLTPKTVKEHLSKYPKLCRS